MAFTIALQERFQRCFVQKRCSQRLSFGEPAYSSDNAVGVALLGADRGQI